MIESGATFLGVKGRFNWARSGREWLDTRFGMRTIHYPWSGALYLNYFPVYLQARFWEVSILIIIVDVRQYHALCLNSGICKMRM